MSIESKVNPGDNFHGWLAVGNDPELLSAYRRVVKALFHPHKSERTPDPHDLEIVRSYGDRALSVAAAMGAVPDEAGTAQPKSLPRDHVS